MGEGLVEKAEWKYASRVKQKRYELDLNDSLGKSSNKRSGERLSEHLIFWVRCLERLGEMFVERFGDKLCARLEVEGKVG